MNKSRVFLIFLYIILIIEIGLRILPFDTDFGITEGNLVLIRDNETKIHRWIGGEVAYELIPNSSHREYRINSLGVRDYEFTPQKPPNTTRIIVLGDSVTFGWNLALNSTFPKHLEQMLNTDSNKYQVINMGVNGYYLNQEIALFREKVIHYQPDIVIFAVTGNDLKGGAWNIFRLEGSTFLVRQSYLYSPTLVKSKKINSLLFKSKIYEFSNFVLYNLFENKMNFNFFYRIENNDLAKKLAEINEMAKIHGIKLCIITIPRVIDFQKYPFTDFHEEVKRISHASRIPHYDLLNEFVNYSYIEFKLAEDDDFHYNDLGNKMIAEHLYSHLINEKI
jgi:lysophospholipase L1-like esterase